MTVISDIINSNKGNKGLLRTLVSEQLVNSNIFYCQQPFINIIMWLCSYSYCVLVMLGGRVLLKQKKKEFIKKYLYIFMSCEASEPLGI